MQKRGFTIVELLIVIVVVAILAAITIVAYNGIQQRASNTSRINSASQYIKLLSAYAVQNGKYPTFTDGACFGTGYTSSQCSNSGLSSTSPATVTEQLTFNSQLSSVGNIPNFAKLNSSATGNGSETGAFIYGLGTTNETPSRWYRLVYFLQGDNQDCGVQRVLRATDGTSAIGTGAYGTGISTGPRNSNFNGGRTWCIISLLNPNEF